MKELKRIQFKCENCGGTVLVVEDRYSSGSAVFCKTCGRSVGSFGDIKSKRVNEALNLILGKVAEQLKK